MKILIATGIYPPDIGGPAQYAKNLESVWRGQEHTVKVGFFRFERKLPSGIRHLWYFFKILPAVFSADFILVLDTFSVALPTVCAAGLFGKKIVLRTGGDFLWESYVERTKNKIIFREFYGFFLEVFYSKEITQKERMIFRTTRWLLHKVDKVIFSTEWQREVWEGEWVYDLPKEKTAVVENYYGKKIDSLSPKNKVFLGATRFLVWKNLDTLQAIFEKESIKKIGATLDMDITNYQQFIDRVKSSYAVILVSLGDISPNMILDAIRCGKPFIVTEQVGIYDRIKNCALFVDPENPYDIAEKIIWLSDSAHYEEQKKKVEAFAFTHSWEEIGGEIIKVYESL